ncbi:hypothetical protein CAEBREN_07345 [Caenorhabditis brenneri]|uniref:Uncharacterized protein n=1 Tax=Caenorhabditis brenneri TaxID=135651 RepID=G0NVQ9_CAEBE|nr:hypothetical protein CAEBREN_07345 [Caenorhabditis brenneri]
MDNHDNRQQPSTSRRHQKATDEEKARGNALKAEKKRLDDLKKEERARFLSQWPEIAVDFKPEVWREAYQRLHPNALAASIDKLEQLEGLSHEDAERKVFEILNKATFIELNLSNNGEQSVQTLFESLDLATENKEDMPFKSTEDLLDFLKSMAPMFKMDVRTRKWKNTGMQTRRFCQQLMQRLQLGDVLDDKNFEETYDDFKTTIEEPNPQVRKFKEAEYHLDVSSYRYLATVVPAFKYDKPSGRLSLNPGAPRLLALHLPILATTLHSNNPKWFDRSRVVTSSATQYGYSFPNMGKSVGVNPATSAIDMSVFRNKFDKLRDEITKQYAILVEPDRLDFANNFVTGSGNVTVDPNGKKQEVDIRILENYLTQCKEKTAVRRNNEEG